MKSTLSVFALVLLLVSKSLYASDNEPYEYASEVIDSLHSTAIAVDRFKNAEGDDLIQRMVNVTTLKYEIDNARYKITPFKTSKNEVISESANTLAVNYSILIMFYDEMINLIQDFHNNPEERMEKQGSFQRKMSEAASSVDLIWQMFPKVVKLVTYTLIDLDRTDEKGKLKYLTITQKQRDSLLKQLEDAYGPDIKKEPKDGTHAIIFSGQILWKFLNDPWSPSDK